MGSFKTLFSFVIFLYLCQAFAVANSDCSDPAASLKKINSLRANVICSSSVNILDCAKTLGVSPSSSTEKDGGLLASSLAGSSYSARNLRSAKPASPPDMKSAPGADAARVARDDKFRNYVKSMPASHATNVSYEQLVDLGKNRPVVVLGGYSGQGYQNPEALRAYIKKLMQQSGDRTLFVIGGTEGGIGDAYKWIPEIAKELNLKDVETAGIVSRNAAEYGVAKQNYITFVDTPVDSWEVKNGSESLMVGIAKDTNGQMVYFRGGDVSKAEITEAVNRGVPVSLITSSDMGANVDAAAKKIAKANPTLARGSPEFEALLKKSLDAAAKPTADVSNMLGANSYLKLVDNPDALSTAPKAGMLESIGLKKLLGAEIAKTGLKALSSPYLMAADLALHSEATGCSDAVDLYVERDKENKCSFYPSITPKFIQFLSMDEGQQTTALKNIPLLCQQMNSLYNKYVENAKLPGVKCSSNGFSTSNRFSVTTDNSGNVLSINGTTKSGFASDVSSINFDSAGNPKDACYRGVRGEPCEKKFSIAQAGPTSIKFNSSQDVSGAEQNTLALLDLYRSNYSTILETASCCQESTSSDQCKKLGVSKPSQQNNLPTSNSGRGVQ